MSDADDRDDDEVLTPEVVDDGGGPQPRTRGPAGGRRPDRRPIFGLSCGLASLVFVVLFPVLRMSPLVILMLAIIGIYLGRQVLRDIDPADGPSKERTQAKRGLAAGLTTIIIIIFVVIYLSTVYEPPDRLVPEFDDKGPVQATSEPAG